MGRCSEPEHSTLRCECGERVVVFGFEEDWRSRQAIFQCECGEKLTLADRLDEEGLTLVDSADAETSGVRELLRSLRAPGT